MSALVLSRCSPRRSNAPRKALKKIIAASMTCSAPKITAIATAPAPEARANSQVGLPACNDIVDDPHAGDDTAHVDARGIRGHAPDGPGAFVQLKLQLAPAKAERRWQPESAGKTLSRRQNLFGALPIDVKQTGASDDEIAISFPAHGLDSQ